MNKIWVFVLIGIGLIGGFAIGSLTQQAIYTAQLERFASNLEGVEINVDFNETLIVDRVYENLEQYGLMDFMNETNYSNVTKT